MKTDYDNIFSATELDYLMRSADDYGWYVWTDEAKSIIEGLCARRLMAPNGDFKVTGCFGPSQTSGGSRGIVSKYFELIGAGRIAFHALRGRQAGFPAAVLARQAADPRAQHV